VLVSLNDGAHSLLLETEKFGLNHALDIDIHAVLDEESSMIQDGTALKLLNHELITLKLGRQFNLTILKEINLVCNLVC
jgi:hypothetical protein